VAMLFCQLARTDSLREICNGLRCCLGKLVHLGVRKAPNKSTLSYANAHRCGGAWAASPGGGPVSGAFIKTPARRAVADCSSSVEKPDEKIRKTNEHPTGRPAAHPIRRPD
jgi:hypothetical protein